MPQHPLESEDFSIVQDHLVTRVTLLAQSGVGDDEWDRELLAVRRDAGATWGHHVAFLLDVTLARFAALAQRELGGVIDDEWCAAFVVAVSDQDHLVADELWASANHAVDVREDGLLATTTALRSIIPRIPLAPTDLSNELPPEYYPAVAS
ncbi:hypothetical protein [Microbacterium suaedae]|uniref:hypothetical protein n=1 Tax=Microbacterium suaedae TaxID=2067813 RepID=UPI000DA25939|nr:hypothetical protein [Microbacterium suaedae]